MKLPLSCHLLGLSIFAAGCASPPNLLQGVTQLGPYQVRPAGFIPQPLAEVSSDPAGVIAGKGEDLAGSMFTQPIDDPLVFSSQANSLVQAVAGPNQTSGSMLEGQNYYREAVGTWNNPWQALFAPLGTTGFVERIWNRA